MPLFGAASDHVLRLLRSLNQLLLFCHLGAAHREGGGMASAVRASGEFRWTQTWQHLHPLSFGLSTASMKQQLLHCNKAQPSPSPLAKIGKNEVSYSRE